MPAPSSVGAWDAPRPAAARRVGCATAALCSTAADHDEALFSGRQSLAEALTASTGFRDRVVSSGCATSGALAPAGNLSPATREPEPPDEPTRSPKRSGRHIRTYSLPLPRAGRRPPDPVQLPRAGPSLPCRPEADHARPRLPGRVLLIHPLFDVRPIPRAANQDRCRSQAESRRSGRRRGRGRGRGNNRRPRARAERVARPRRDGSASRARASRLGSRRGGTGSPTRPGECPSSRPSTGPRRGTPNRARSSPRPSRIRRRGYAQSPSSRDETAAGQSEQTEAREGEQAEQTAEPEGEHRPTSPRARRGRARADGAASGASPSRRPSRPAKTRNQQRAAEEPVEAEPSQTEPAAEQAEPATGEPRTKPEPSRRTPPRRPGTEASHRKAPIGSPAADPAADIVEDRQDVVDPVSDLPVVRPEIVVGRDRGARCRRGRARVGRDPAAAASATDDSAAHGLEEHQDHVDPVRDPPAGRLRH